MAGSWGDAGRFLTLGLEMVISTAIGLGIGIWLDDLTGWKPWLTLIFAILGICAGFRTLLIRTGVLARNRGDSDNSDH